ncbi:MAG: FAD-dependent monooxygenase, partial [Actinomycetota bacterium]
LQFHRDGFRPGNPSVADPAAALPPPVAARPLPDEVDVLIVGSGPTGLTLAAQLAAFPALSVALVEAKPGPLQVGQADGIACRTMEMFEAFGFAHEVRHEAYWVNETVFWKPDPDRPDHIGRSDRIPDVEDGLSEQPHVILNQARVHDFFLEVMRNAERPMTPHYGHRLLGLDPPRSAHDPVVAQVAAGDDPSTEVTVRARYVVGCDGARSQVRRSMGRELVGDAANQAWGVMDVLGVTDFPDIRFKVIVQSNNDGNLLIIPREGGYLARFYIELDKLGSGERAADRNVSLEELVAAANRILHPYTLTVAEVPWWSVYEIGQRLCDRFDDLGPDEIDRRTPRVFIAGDACHTHSPKAGQGMNVSMRDGFNLGWKLASVLLGRADPAILTTYSEERRALAKELIDFDRELAAMISAPPKVTSDGEGVDPAEFQRYFQQHGRFTAGVATHYWPSLLTGGDEDQHLAAGFVIGTRFHSAPVVRLADAKPVHLGHVVEADGRWRLYAFADRSHPADPDAGLAALCRFLADDPRSPVLRYTPAGADVDAVFDLRAVIQQPHDQLTVADVPELLVPRVGRHGLIDYEKVFCAEPGPGPDIFDQRNIDRARGALVVVRPDQHVANVLALDAVDRLADFFDRFLLVPEAAPQPSWSTLARPDQ